MNPWVQKIIDNQPFVVLSVTGGGAEIIGELTRYGGASKFLIDAVAPWDQSAFMQFVQTNKPPDKFCSTDAALALAVASYRHGMVLKPNPNMIGVGVTAKLGYSSEREGREHEAHIAIQTANTSVVHSIQFKARRSREEESKLLSEMAITCIAQAKILSYSPLGFLSMEDELNSEGVEAKADLAMVVQHNLPAARYPVATKPKGESPTKVVFCGSFNPIHKNHKTMCDIAHRLTGHLVDLEISVTNTDKPPLDFISINKRKDLIERRCVGMDSVQNLYLTDMPTFREKVAYFGGVTFIVGADTFNRICNPIYQGTEEKMLASFDEYAKAGVRFLVFQRDGVELCNRYPTINTLCQIVPSDLYLDDGHSSTKERLALK